MKPKKIALLAGDGIGREVVPAARRVLEHLCGDRLTFDEAEMGWEAFERTGNALPAATLDLVKRCDAAILGAVGSPSHRVDGYKSPVIQMRRELDLFANLRPLRSPTTGIDLLIVRENTEGLYSGRERLEGKDTAISERVITRRATERIAKVAFQHARERAGRGGEPGPRSAKVTIVHKANVLRIGDGLFREVALEVAGAYPDIEVEEQLVDSMAYRMVREPQAFDVVLAPNLYGDILSDLGAALTGGLGVAPSANLGPDFCLAEPVHGSAPDIAGKGSANPLATLRAGAMLLHWLGLDEQSQSLQSATDQVLADGPKTPDLGGSASTDEVTDAVLQGIREQEGQRTRGSENERI